VTREQVKSIFPDVTDEQLTKILDLNTSDIGKAKAEYEAVTEAKKALEQQIKDRDRDIADLKKSAENNADLSKKYQELQDKYTADTEALNKAMADSRKNSAVDMAILQAKGKNAKAIKALLDMEKITLKEDGALEGLNLEELKKSDGYLFEDVKNGIEGTGFTQGAQTTGFDDLNSQVAAVMGVK
jgi:membrane-associated HD superfamily phosphohydrolase